MEVYTESYINPFVHLHVTIQLNSFLGILAKARLELPWFILYQSPHKDNSLVATITLSVNRDIKLFATL